MGSVSVRVRLRKRVEKSGVVIEDGSLVWSMPNLAGGCSLKLEEDGTPGQVASKTCIKSSRNSASPAPSDWESLCPAQLMSRMLRSTAGTMLLFFRRAKVRICSSGIDLAGGVVGGGAAAAAAAAAAGEEEEGGMDTKSKLDPEDWRRVCVGVGDEGESLLTKASADFEKTKPRCCKAFVTV